MPEFGKLIGHLMPGRNKAKALDQTPKPTTALVPEYANPTMVHIIGQYLFRWHNLLADPRNAKPSPTNEFDADFFERIGSFDYSLRIPNQMGKEASVKIGGAATQHSVRLEYIESAGHSDETILQGTPFDGKVHRIDIEYGDDFLELSRNLIEGTTNNRYSRKLAVHVYRTKPPQYSSERLDPDPSVRLDATYHIPDNNQQPIKVERGRFWADGAQYSEGLSDEAILQTMQALDTIISQAAGVLPLTVPALTEAPQVIIPERTRTSWTYEQLQHNLVNVVYGKEIPFDRLPTGQIDFGQIAKETEALVLRHMVNPAGNEHEKTIGVLDNKLIFSQANADGTPWSAVDKGYHAFDEQTRETLDGLAGMTHSHSNRLVFTSQDILPLLEREGIFPLMAAGIPNVHGAPGCLLFAVRSAETTKLHRDTQDQATIEEWVQQLSQLIDDKYGYLLDEAESVAEGKMHAGQLTDYEVHRINKPRDRMIREIASDEHIALYIAPLGSTVATRVDLSRPILDQIPPKTVNERRIS